jgi:ubiquinone/menaquinone biosynthesis C-methylase UbiE
MSNNSNSTQYEKQDRGTAAAYEAYFAGMNASMQQKVALTTAHFPVHGRIADMGSGSGRGTYDLACLYETLELIGVDINPISVKRSRTEFQRQNLSYERGDISEMVFPADSLDGILDSSVLHHVTSFNDFSVERVYLALDRQVAQLKPDGVIVIRDFVIPDGPETVYLDLSSIDGAAAGTIPELSSAALFENFSQTWRSSVNRDEPVAFCRLQSPRSGFIRYQVALRAAAEFVLRKDYRTDWATEALEEYTYLSQSQFESAFRSRGLRIVTSRPLWNPWIVKNRFENKFYLSDLAERALPFPPTNYLIVGEKINGAEGAELVESDSKELTDLRFLSLTAHRQVATGEVFELVQRPHQTVDVLPWFELDGQVFIFAKKDFPRPIVNAVPEQTRLDHAAFSGYVTEPITAIVEPEESLSDAVPRILIERAGFAADEILNLGASLSYYTSPGGINERVLSCAVQVRPRVSTPVLFPNYTQFKSAGSVRELDATQVLRACHVGGMYDARIEIGIYHLLRELGLNPGPWIGAPVKVTAQAVAPPSTNESILSPAPLVAFEPIAPSETRFLSVREGIFVERTPDGQQLSAVRFEYVLPRDLSISTISALPVVRTENDVFVGIELRDLPAVQSFSNNSRIATVPAWRLPRSVKHVMEVPSFLSERMLRDFKLRVREVWELGGAYFASPGVTPESIYPFVVEIDGTRLAGTDLSFIAINDLKERLDQIQDGHLLIAACRLIHALAS